MAEADRVDVHRARVAARRLRSLCRTFRPLLRQQATAYGEALKRVAALLGELRDIDVMADLPAMRSPRIARALRGARQLEVRRLRSRLDQRHEIERFRVRGRDASAALVPDDISRTDALRRTRRAWRRAAARLKAAPVGDRALHELRIALKNVRYAVEEIDKTSTGKAFVKQLRAAQDVLGTQRDLVLARRWLRVAAIPEAERRAAILCLQREGKRQRAEAGAMLARLSESGRQWERAVTAAIDA